MRYHGPKLLDLFTSEPGPLGQSTVAGPFSSDHHSWAILVRPSDTLKSIPVAALTASKEVSGSEENIVEVFLQ